MLLQWEKDYSADGTFDYLRRILRSLRDEGVRLDGSGSQVPRTARLESTDEDELNRAIAESLKVRRIVVLSL